MNKFLLFQTWICWGVKYLYTKWRQFSMWSDAVVPDTVLQDTKVWNATRLRYTFFTMKLKAEVPIYARGYLSFFLFLSY
jgi:hypothetical protein